MNSKQMLLTVITIFFIVCSSVNLKAVPAAVNSYAPLPATAGPTMPFPQFLNYPGANSLASHLPDGVTLMEMEQWMRDGWQIFANEFTYTGATVTYGGGPAIQLITDNSTPYCSEGHGYALLGAAIMADKKTFDGLWFHLNENGYFNKTLVYSTGAMHDGTYKYGSHSPEVYGAGSDTAADGDVDIAMAALIAWKQWGDNTGYYAPGGTGAAGPGGNMIQYKQMALDSIRFLVERDHGDNPPPDTQYSSGDIGFDGYDKGGNTGGGHGGEATGWGLTAGSPYFPDVPQFANAGGSLVYFDYCGPGYTRAFMCALQEAGEARDSNNQGGGWTNINQFRRAAASEAWVMGYLANNYNFTHAATFGIAGATATFAQGAEAEQFRAPLRHVLEYIWFGNPTETWNTTTHQPQAGGNTYEYTAGLKTAALMKNPQAFGNICETYGMSPITYGGTASTVGTYSINGIAGGMGFHNNWPYGSGASSFLIYAQANNDWAYAGEAFREMMIEWDIDTPGDGYISSVPYYFHGFYRVIGLTTITGNWINPCSWLPTANMKVFKSIDKTYSFPGDILTYRINYRNYASVQATGVKIIDTLPAGLAFVSTSYPAGASYSVAGAPGSEVITWNIPNVPGLQGTNMSATMNGVTLVTRVLPTALGKYCNTADISCTNGTGWRTDDVANNMSSVMETNCVDIVAGALTITKTASTHLVNPGDTITYTLENCNSSNAGWINGGRSGVNFSFAVDTVPGNEHTLTMYLRANHAAAEPVVDWANYRMSYFLNSPYHGTAATGGDWSAALADITMHEGFDNITTVITAQDLVAGSDAQGSWNQRIMINFGSALSVPTHHLFNYYGLTQRIHQGNTFEPFLMKFALHAGWNSQDWTDDWSQQPATSVGAQGDPLIPISPDWTKGDGTSVPVWKINKHACETSPVNIGNVLIEEWDGYTWRRVFGNGPLPGRQVDQVVVTDSLPTQVTFGGWIGTAGTQAGRTLSWNDGTMLVSECKTHQYWVTANTMACPAPDAYALNIAYVVATKEAPVSDSELVTITCNAVPTPTPAPASITKTANTGTYNINDSITYTINYTNKYGSVIDSPLSAADAANWTNRGTGTSMAITGGTIQSSGQNTAMTYNYSHGTNGVITARLNMSGSSVFGIVLRHTAVSGHANGSYITFKPNTPNPGTIQFWNGTTPIQTYNDVPGTLGNAFDVKIDLQGGTVRVYLKKTTDAAFNAVPNYLVTGMTVQAGYAGFINGTPAAADAWSSSNTGSLFHTELDTSINTLIRDPLPSCVTFVGGDNGAFLDTAPNPDEVRWPLIPALNYDAAINYRWWGTINCSCQNITNTAYAVPTGIASIIADGVIVGVNCGATTPTFTPTRTRTSTQTPSMTYSLTHTPSFTRTFTLTPTLSSTLTASPSFTLTRTVTASPTYTFTQNNTSTFTRTASPSPTLSVTDTNTFTNTHTPTSTRTASPSLTVTDTISSNTPTHTLTSTNTFTATQTWTSSVSPTSTVPTATFTHTNSMTASPTNTDTFTYTATNTSTGTFTDTPTLTHTLTVTDTMSSNTPTHTPTWSNTATATQSWTQTGTRTYTPTYTDTVTMTGTPVIFTHTVTPTYTDTRTYTSTPTQSSTATDTPTYTATRTYTETLTVTDTRTATATPSATATVTDTSTVTPTPRPSPVMLDITLEVTGDEPKAGALVTYVIILENNTTSPVTNVAVWDTLHQDMMFVSNDFEITPVQTGNYLYWDISHDSLGNPFTLNPDQHIRIEFTVRLIAVIPANQPFFSEAGADYNDPFYVSPAKHPPIGTEMSYYPIGRPVVFPNPFNLDTDTVVRFDNVVPGSLIQIYTLSGEAVNAIYTGINKATWDSKNRNGKAVSPGIYFFVIKNQSNGEVRKGKLFVVRGN